jgi:pimeloyl-ACP methyl ester carboxylesterase
MATRPSDFAGDAVALLDALAIPRAMIVGHSMGSLIAQRIAIDHPHRVAALMLVGAFAEMRGNPEIETLWADTISVMEDPVAEDFVWAFQSGTCAQPVPVGLIEAAVQESLKVPARVWRDALAGQIAADLGAERARITAPTRLVWGARDSFAPRADQEALLASIGGADLTIYRESGHAPHWEEPGHFARDLADFAAVAVVRSAAA